jgi:20S proteasome subunit beta 3
MEYNGSGMVAMAGRNCVAIASDMRYGVQQTTIAENMPKVFKMNDKTFVGLSGLATDMQTLHNKFKFRLKMYSLREEREIRPKVFANMVASVLYEHRFGPFFVEPRLAGLERRRAPVADSKESKEKKEEGDAKEAESEWEPYICAMDLIGAPVETNDFLVAGSASEQLYGCCEAMYRPDLEPEDLFETISQCLLAAVDRDCLAGWGAIVHIITPEGVETRQLKSRKD